MLSDEVEQLYRHILRSLPAGLPEHADAMSWPLRQTQRVFRDLERLRLARSTPDGMIRVEDPRVSVGRLLDGEESDLDERRRRLLELRESLESLEFDYRRGLQLSGPRVPSFEQVASSDSPGVVEHLYRTSTGPVVQVVRDIAVGPGHEQAIRRQWEAIAASGRTLRTIFPLSVLTDPEWQSFAQHRSDAGEQQRYLPDDALRVEFGVFGRSGVLVDEGGGGDMDYLLLRPQPVVEVFLQLFEELWRRADPVLAGDASAQDVKLLELLALGFKDEAIARQLGLGLRTVRRRIAAMMEEHGVDTRFQLGMAVSRRGLVE